MKDINKRTRKALTISIVTLVVIIIGVAIYNKNWNLPIKLDAANIMSIEIDDFDIKGVQLVLYKKSNNNEIKNITKIFNQSKKFRDDVGTTHPIRVSFMLEDESIVSMWYGTQGFIAVSDEVQQFNMQNIKLEDYFDKLLQNTIPLKLVVSDIASIEIYDTSEGTSKRILTLNPSEDNINEIVELYNKSDRYRDDVGTTHPIRVHISMNDESYLSLGYGTQGFITVSNANTQFNMKNNKLEYLMNLLMQKQD